MEQQPTNSVKCPCTGFPPRYTMLCNCLVCITLHSQKDVINNSKTVLTARVKFKQAT